MNLFSWLPWSKTRREQKRQEAEIEARYQAALTESRKNKMGPLEKAKVAQATTKFENTNSTYAAERSKSPNQTTSTWATPDYAASRYNSAPYSPPYQPLWTAPITQEVSPSSTHSSGTSSESPSPSPACSSSSDSGSSSDTSASSSGSSSDSSSSDFSSPSSSCDSGPATE